MQIVNSDRYPINQKQSDRYRELISGGRDQLVSDGALALEQFITEPIIQSVLETEDRYAHLSHRMQGMYNPYSDALNADDDLSLPETHPARIRLPAAHQFLAADIFARNDPLIQLYQSPDFVGFITDLLELEQLYPLADPLGSVNLLTYQPGDSNGWHFDTTEFVISIMIRPAESGGHYQFVPNLRSDDDPNLAQVSARMLCPDEPEGRRQVTLTAGTLFLFKGRNTLHRVTEISGSQARVVAILSYHHSPAHMLSDSSKMAMYGRTKPLALD